MTAFTSIDIHAHFYPESYLRMIDAQGAPFGYRCDLNHPDGPRIDMDGRPMPLEGRFVDLDNRLVSMDEQGVDVHALSLTTPMVYWAGPELGLRLSIAYNDACAAAHEAHPDRFLGLATLPMNAPELAVEELARAAGLPGIRGVYMATCIGDRELSDPSFFPVYEQIEALGWTIFLHPVKVVSPARLERFYLTNFIGNPTESAIAASHLIFGEVLDRFPDLTFCLPHAGGTFPFLIGRITHGWSVRAECRHLERPPSDYLRRFYYDTITHSRPALEYLIDLVGADRVVLGSDFCFDMSYQRPVEVVTQQLDLDDDDQALILGGNAARLLGLGR